MSGKSKRWQANIWLGKNEAEAITVYAGSIAEIRQIAKEWLLIHCPPYFANLPAHHHLAHRLTIYFYSDGTYQIPVFSTTSPDQVRILPPGWYQVAGDPLYPQPLQLDNFEHAVADFGEQALLIDAGPDFNDPIEVDRLLVARWVTHPALHGALVGGFVAICYLAMPGTTGTPHNFVLAYGSVTILILFALFMMSLFALLGQIIFRSMAMLEAARERQQRKSNG